MIHLMIAVHIIEVDGRMIVNEQLAWVLWPLADPVIFPMNKVSPFDVNAARWLIL